MDAVSDANTGKPDAIGRMSGEIRIHRERGYATMTGVLEGRKVKVKITYSKSDFTIDQVRRDLNAALSKYEGKGDEQRSIRLSSNVWLEFKGKVKSKGADAAAKSAIHVHDEEEEKEGNPTPKPVDLLNRMTILNERVDTFTEDELKAILDDMRAAMPLQPIDLQKGRNALLLLKASYGTLIQNEEPVTIDNLKNQILAMHIPILELSDQDVDSLIQKLEEMIAANPIADQPRWVEALDDVIFALKDMMKADPPLESPTAWNVKSEMQLDTRHGNRSQLAFQRLQASFLRLIPTTGSPLEDVEAVQEALSKVMSQAAGASLTLERRQQDDGQLQYVVSYHIATQKQILDHIKSKTQI